MTDLPVVITAAGVQPTPPATILANLIALVSASNPGYTANLPGSLIEDISSTDVGAIALIDQARVELMNSLTPYGANAFLLNQLGQIYGVPLGQGSNTSVYVVFTGSVGFVISKGFTVSDGTNRYVVQDGGIVETGGVSPPLYCLAAVTGTWAVPAGTVNQIVTSVPSTIVLSVNNPTAGTPGSSTQTEGDYRAQVLQAGKASAQGTPSFLKTVLGNVPGVQNRLVSVRQSGSGWEVLVGGGDPYAVAYAIYQSLFDVNALVGSVMSVSGITNANPGVVTTSLNHGLTTGQTATIAGSTNTAFNGTYTITVLSQTTFSIGVDTSTFGTYTGGGVVTPNGRNMRVTITDYPDSYTIPFVIPPQQAVTMTVTWNTSIASFTQQTAVAAQGSAALIAYVNSLPVGAPMNLFELQDAFKMAITTLVPPALLTRMVFAVSINGVGVSPTAGTGIIAGDPESYFQAAVNSVTVVQG